MERTLFRRRLALGATLLRLFCVTRAAVRPVGPVLAADGTPLQYHEQRPTTYDSVFGKMRFGRHYFAAPGQAGSCPLDAALSLLARCYSDLLCEWVAYGATDESYRESQRVIERILGVSLSVQAIEASVAEAAREVPAFYAQPAELPAPVPDATILVVQADGNGGPLVQPSPAAPPVRLAKGQKRGQKKEAVVTGLYTVAPYQRTAQEVVAALLREPGSPQVSPAQRRGRRNCMPPWRVKRLPCAKGWSGLHCGKAPISSTGSRSPMGPRRCSSRW